MGFLAGADFEMTPRATWGRATCGTCASARIPARRHGRGDERPVAFPRCPWALDLSDKPFPGRGKTKPDPLQLGGWYWESGFDRDPIAEMEYDPRLELPRHVRGLGRA